MSVHCCSLIIALSTAPGCVTLCQFFQEAAKGFRHRDDLLAIQSKAQEKWSKEKIFEADAPEGGEPLPEGKFFGNFPYPYMNGVLHLGHAFSVSKLEFAAAYQRLIGKRVLFPQGFHCTGDCPHWDSVPPLHDSRPWPFPNCTLHNNMSDHTTCRYAYQGMC